MAAIHDAKDNSVKLILAEHELFMEFLRDFISIDILNDVSSEDIEDISERFLPLFQEARDSDTIKRIRLKNHMPLYVIAIVEHESKVNYRSSFKMLQYITLVLGEYEKDANKAKKGAARRKDFKYPPVLPIIFYDGPGKWKAETNFLNKTELSDVFGKYIPKFEYELVSLNRYSEADLIEFGDILSLVMLIDKVQTPEDLSRLSKLPQDYLKRIESLNIPDHLRELLMKVITVLLTRINAPKGEIDSVTDRIYKRRIQEMFAMLKPYDVQETRRLEREKVQAEMRETIQAEVQEKVQAEREMAQAREREAQAREKEAQAREKEMREEINRLMQTREREIQEAVRKAVQAERERILTEKQDG